MRSSQHAALPEGRIACLGSRWWLGGLAEVSEEPGDVLRLGDEGEEAHTLEKNLANSAVPGERRR